MSVAPTPSAKVQKPSNETNAVSAPSDNAVASGTRCRTVTRVFLFQHNACPVSNDENGRNAGFMAPVPGQEVSCWAPTELGIDVPHGDAVRGLQNARVRRVRCLEVMNGFPMVLGLKSNSLPMSECTNTGERFVMTCLPGTNKQPQILFEADESSVDAIKWAEQYPAYTRSNLHQLGVMSVSNQPIVFVDRDHPVIALLRTNREFLGSDIDQQQLIQGRYHTLSRQVFQHACDTLQKKVLSNISHCNLENFHMSLSPLDNGMWANIGPEHVNGEFEHDQNDKVKGKTYPFAARIELTYDFPC